MGSGHPVLVADMHAEPSVLREAREAGLRSRRVLPHGHQSGADRSAGRSPRCRGDGAFTDAEVAATEAFASAAAVGLALGTARESLEHLRMVSDQERIARDLHDTVIQRLFGLGMGLQGAQRLADERLAERIGPPWRRSTRSSGRSARRSSISTDPMPPAWMCANRCVSSLPKPPHSSAIRPRVSFRGPVEAAMTEPLLAQLLAVLREALSNVARHARASRVDVVVQAEPSAMTLSVADDGIGPAGRTPGRARTGKHGSASRRPGRRCVDRAPAPDRYHPAMASPALAYPSGSVAPGFAGG